MIGTTHFTNTVIEAERLLEVAVGQRYFGYDFDYQPIEQRAKEEAP